MDIKQIINTQLKSNTYVLLDSNYNYCWLVDIGDYKRIIRAIPTGMEIRGVFLTHTHHDHIYGLNDLLRHSPNICVMTSAFGKNALYDDRMNFSKYYETPFIFEGSKVEVLEEGNRYELFPETYLDVHETPGHCPSCLTYVVDDYIFTGDAYIPGEKVVTKLRGGDKLLAKESIDRIKELCAGKYICPGHGKITMEKM